MTIPQAVSQLLEIESLCVENVLSPKATLAISLSHIGGRENQHIVSGTLEEVGQQPSNNFGERLYSLVIVGKRLHHLEVEYHTEDAYAVCREAWREVAKKKEYCYTLD